MNNNHVDTYDFGSFKSLPIPEIMGKLEKNKREDERIEKEKEEKKVSDQRICKDCGRPFVINVGERRFYERTFNGILPMRCPACRQRRKQYQQNAKSA